MAKVRPQAGSRVERASRTSIIVHRPSARRWVSVAALAGATLALATALVAVLERQPFGIVDASPVYLIAVVAVGSAGGTWPALLTAVAAFLLYDVLFTEPRYSLVIADPRELLDLVLFLLVAVAIGRLVAVQRSRAEEADQRAHEANSLFALSRLLATAPDAQAAAASIAGRLRDDVGLERVWIAIGPTGRERVIADTGISGPPPESAVVTTLIRTQEDQPARWVRTHTAKGVATRSDDDQLRVTIAADGVALGWVGALRDRAHGPLPRAQTRMLALAADQFGIGLRRDELRQTATDLEVARRGDALKTSLIDSVSHDLRTPLAAVRATAGGLADPAVTWTDAGVREAGGLIDAEAARLDRLVRGVLDLSRIASGSLDPHLEPHELVALVEPVIARTRLILGDRPMTIDVPADLPAVKVDAVLLDLVVTNLLENVATHADPAASVVVRAGMAGSDRVLLVVEDGGPGVPDRELGRLFDRFHRVPQGVQGSRRGLGIGLSVVKGLTEAMGGSVAASPSPLGGLAITVSLQTEPAPPELAG
jgi:two-component system sensor histidine kinase KdpD